jgi:two-component system sensor histidine kinase RegB
MTSVVLNVVLTWLSGRHPHLADREAALYLAFDILQLTLLLHLTGGLFNPFSILILAPLAIGATTLSRRSTIALWLFSTLAISALAVWHEPLPWQGTPPTLSPVYELGIWVALLFGTSMITAYGWRVAEDSRRLSNALAATQHALDREYQVSELGALAAAAAHELGSPLSTIAVIAKELARDPALGNTPEARADLQLLLEQADRCREILAGLSRRGAAVAPPTFESVGLGALVEEAAAPYRVPHVTLEVRLVPEDSSSEPRLSRRPELRHGIGNLVQNALQFARERVTAEIAWNQTEAKLVIRDDGPGFAPPVLARLGEPYFSSRGGEGEHLGLGVFIAETLLSRTGARISFENAPTGGGIVSVKWRRQDLEGRRHERKNSVARVSGPLAAGDPTVRSSLLSAT